jgi:hypothetical protein
MIRRALLDRELWAAFLSSRVIYFVAVASAALLAAHPAALEVDWPDARGWGRLLDAAFFSADSHWYWRIIHDGYEHRPYTHWPQANWGFFPLYPMLVRMAGSGFWSGVLLSNALAIVGLALVQVIVQRLRDEEIARRTVKLMCFYPISFVLSSYRSEALFLVLLAGCYLALLDQRFWIAGLLGALLTLTRPQGMLVAGLIGFEALRARRFRPGIELLACALPLLALAAFSAYEWQLTGNWKAWFDIQRFAWGHRQRFPLAPLAEELIRPRFFSDSGWSFPFFNAICALGALAGAALLLRGASLGLGLFTLTAVLFSLFGGTVAGMLRYVVPLFGLYLAWAAALRRGAYEMILAVFAALLGLWGALMGLGINAATG